MYGKATETAIAAMSRLAEVYDDGKTRLSAGQIAESRNLQTPFVAKVLSTLSQAGLVIGSRGPGGGYILALQPGDIKIYDIWCLFEREDQSSVCPFGGGLCGVGDPCAMHAKLVAVQTAIDQVLHETTLEAFRKAYQDDGLRPSVDPSDVPAQRTSFRAPTGD